jgi:hypothetical protein
LAGVKVEAQFLTPLETRDLGGNWFKNYWMLLSELAYYSALLEKVIMVPKGFVCDMASVPKLPLLYWFFGATANGPAVLHDWLYRVGLVTRLLADRVFNEAMAADGKWAITRWPMTAGVMVGGVWSYKQLPGCLDVRGCKVRSMDCTKCCNIYPDYEKTIITLEEWNTKKEQI